MRDMPMTFSATPPESLSRNHVSKRTQAVYSLVQNVSGSGLPHLSDETPLVGLIDLDLVDVGTDAKKGDSVSVMLREQLAL